MTVVAPTPDWQLATVLVVMLALAVTASALGNLGVGRAHLTAAARAVVQLTLVSLILAATLQSLGWSIAFSGLMLAVATFTSARRLRTGGSQTLWVGLAITVGAVPMVGMSLASGVIPLNGVGIVPFAGIVIGGVMTAATLTGRRAFDELDAQHGSHEAALALGFADSDAALLVIQPSAKEALLPGLDQTRTVGLVTLPGAFIGVLLGGGTPVQAGAAQVLVLFALMAGQAITAAAMLRLIAHGRVSRRNPSS